MNMLSVYVHKGLCNSLSGKVTSIFSNYVCGVHVYVCYVRRNTSVNVMYFECMIYVCL